MRVLLGGAVNHLLTLLGIYTLHLTLFHPLPTPQTNKQTNSWRRRGPSGTMATSWQCQRAATRCMRPRGMQRLPDSCQPSTATRGRCGSWCPALSSLWCTTAEMQRRCRHLHRQQRRLQQRQRQRLMAAEVQLRQQQEVEEQVLPRRIDGRSSRQGKREGKWLDVLWLQVLLSVLLCLNLPGDVSQSQLEHSVR